MHGFEWEKASIRWSMRTRPAMHISTAPAFHAHLGPKVGQDAGSWSSGEQKWPCSDPVIQVCSTTPGCLPPQADMSEVRGLRGTQDRIVGVARHQVPSDQCPCLRLSSMIPGGPDRSADLLPKESPVMPNRWLVVRPYGRAHEHQPSVVTTPDNAARMPPRLKLEVFPRDDATLD
jgi:hypothetical protein